MVASATERDVRQALAADQPLSVVDDIQGLMNEQIAELQAAGERPATPTAIDVRTRYLFRSDPGHRLVGVRIPGVPNCKTDTEEAFYRRKYEEKYGKTERARFERIAKAVGNLTISFTAIDRKQECYFATDNIDVATYLRSKIGDGTLPQVYEDAALTPEEKAMPSHRAQAAMRLDRTKGD